MIPVKKNFQKIPKGLTGARFREKVKQLLSDKADHLFSKDFYRHHTVIEELEILYHKKCAYCETNPHGCSWLRVDHHRPKKTKKGEDGYSGYYWLAYEWSNLLPVCEKCNTKKSSSFPIEEPPKRILKPELAKKKKLVLKEYRRADSERLRAEKPLLIHPEVDNPFEHLKFLPDGTIEGVTNRGKWTIEICGLNREDLVLARKKLVDDFLADFEEILRNYWECVEAKSNVDSALATYLELSLRSLFNKLFKLNEPSKEYSRLGWFMFYQFELFFVKRLSEKKQRLLSEAYGYYIRNYC